MNKEEKIKLELQKLKWKSDYKKFEYDKFVVYFLSLIGILIAIFIPAIISFRGNFFITLIVLLIFLFLFLIVIYRFFSFNEKILDEIFKLSKQIDEKFKEVLKNHSERHKFLSNSASFPK